MGIRREEGKMGGEYRMNEEEKKRRMEYK